MAPKPRTLLLALGTLALVPGLSTSLVLAQSSSEPTSAGGNPAAPGLTGSPAVTRPGASEFRAQPPQQFNHSLEQLEREGVITSAERARAQQRDVRVHSGLLPQLNANQRQACATGAMSSLECRTGVVMRGRGNGSVQVVGGGTPANDDINGSAPPLPPITVPVDALLAGAGGNFRLSDVFGRTPRPAPIAGNGNRSLIFPLIGSAEVSSGFGWRLHPIIGTWIVHAGRDLAAPEGTPVVAALSGRVMSSGLNGGYGLAIEVEHDGPRRRTLYGHLSELYVREGQTVRQGEVIGRVGSTGLSTGPHLHFELRLFQDGGWVAVDPGQLDQGGLFATDLAGGTSTDAVALLVGQLVHSLERPRSPLGSTASAPPATPAPRPGH